MIAEDVRVRIRRLYFAEHWKINTIATELGLHHDTVELALCHGRFSNQRFPSGPHKLDPYRDFIQGTLEQYPRLRCTRLFEMLRGRGYDGSVGTLRRYVRRVRPRPRCEAFCARVTGTIGPRTALSRAPRRGQIPPQQKGAGCGSDSARGGCHQ